MLSPTAASHGHVDTAKALLTAGANTRIRNNKRERARDIAEINGQPRMLSLLEQHVNNTGWLKIMQ
ncbi:MAG: ankyrin repeat domain-containing protein [Gammaproteobacteria bacterium]